MSQVSGGRASLATLALGAGFFVHPCPAADSASIDTSALFDARARHEVLQTLAQQLESRYVVPDTAKKLAVMLREKDRVDAYRTITSEPEFARVLTEDLDAIAHDKHMRVNYAPGPAPKEEKVSRHLSIPAELAETLRQLNGMIPKVEVLEGNVGYVRVDGLAPLSISHDAITAAFAFIHQTEGLIIDCRTNGGGEGDTVAFIISHLTEGPPRVVNSLTDRTSKPLQEFRTSDLGAASYGARKPVFVLTSNMTFSSGEMLAYDLQALKRALIVGEVTAGGANPPGGAPLGHHLLALIPETRFINSVTGSNWEGVGVSPDLAVPANVAHTQAYQLAIERLLRGEKNPTRRAVLEAVDAKLQTFYDAQSGGAPLRNDQVSGAYTLANGLGPTVTILERDGELLQRIEGMGDVALIRVSGNRFARRGEPEGAFTSFLVKDGVTKLVIEAPPGPPTLRDKR